LGRQHPRQKAERKQRTAQGVATRPLGDKVVTAAERDFERLETPGYVLGVFRLCVPGTR
jgi:hypothetical protein